MSKPNLLFLYTDEQAYATLRAYGNTRIHMPNLDRLAEQAVVFDRAYVTQPVCTPSRASLLTGLYPHTHGCIENNQALGPDIPCLPEMVPDPSYVTAHFGKWHLGDELFAQHGFQHWAATEDCYNKYLSADRDPDARSAYHHFLIENGFTPVRGGTFGRGEAARLPEAYGKPAFLARQASHFIRAHRDRPFILYVNFLEPHMPFFGPRDDQYDPREIPLPATLDLPPDATRPLKTRLLAEAYRQNGHSGVSLQTPADWQKLIARYWGLCSLVDTHVGTILETLTSCGLDENTIVVFTSDHGDMMGSHALLAKCVMFEEAVRVPLMIRLPGQREGRRVRGPVSHVDVVPTLLELLQQPVPAHLQGSSLRELLTSEPAESTNNVFIEWNGINSPLTGKQDGQIRLPPDLAGQVSRQEVEAGLSDPVRTVITLDGWKLNHSPLGEHELYHLDEDPKETVNVYTEKQHRARIDNLRQILAQWQERTGDTAPPCLSPNLSI